MIIIEIQQVSCVSSDVIYPKQLSNKEISTKGVGHGHA